MELLSRSCKVMEFDVGKCMYGADKPTVDDLCRSNQSPFPFNVASIATPYSKTMTFKR